MPPFTLGQAAKATGRSKAGILDAIRSGRLAATRDEKNQWQIDPAELAGVYPLNITPGVPNEREQTPPNAQALSPVQEKIDFLERIVAELESERDDLRRRLDNSETERRETQTRLTALLTTERPPAVEPAAPEAAPDPQQAANENPPADSDTDNSSDPAADTAGTVPNTAKTPFWRSERFRDFVMEAIGFVFVAVSILCILFTTIVLSGYAPYSSVHSVSQASRSFPPIL